MPLLVLEDALKPVKEALDELDFANTIRECRECLGLKQYRAAEYIGVNCARLKNLETGYFRDMPSPAEIQAFARLYDLNPNMLEKKAEEHCRDRTKSIRSKPVFTPAQA